MLEYKGNRAKALVGSPTVLLGKEQIILSSPLRRQNSTIYVPEDFESKVLAPFGVSLGALPQIESSSRVHTIVIDAGHGGKDHGTTFSSGMNEKEMVLDIAKRLRGLLDGAGIKVVMTRDTDEFIPLPQRTEIAARCGADLFISIHVNSNQDRHINGLLVYYIGTIEKRYSNTYMSLGRTYFEPSYCSTGGAAKVTVTLADLAESDVLVAFRVATAGVG